MEDFELLNGSTGQGSVEPSSGANEMAPESSSSSLTMETIFEFAAIARIAAHKLSQFKDRGGKNMFQDAYRVSPETATKLTALGIRVVNNTVYTKASKMECTQLKAVRATRADGTEFFLVMTNRSDEERAEIARQQIERQEQLARLEEVEAVIERLTKLGVSPDKALDMAMSHVK